MRIDLWSDIACPWCYVGLTRFRRVLAGFEHAADVTVEVHSFQLDSNLPESYPGTEVEYLAGRKGLPEASVRQMFTHVQDAAASEGLTLDFDGLRVANSWRAHRLIHAARGVDAATAIAVKLALFDAYFTTGQLVTDPAVLRSIAAAHSVPADVAEHALAGPARRPDAADLDDLDRAIVADLDQAARYGISGVPFFVLADRYGVSGAQPAEVFEQALRQVWAETHPAPITVLPGLPDAGGAGAVCGPEGCS